MEIGVSREPGDGKGQELAAGRGGICSSFPPGTLWWSVATFPRPAARLGSCQENSFYVSLNIPLLLGGKKHQPKPELLLLLELASWLNWAFFFFINKCCQALFFQWSHECVSRWGADLPSTAMAEIWAGWSSCGVLCRQPSGDHWGVIIIP